LAQKEMTPEELKAALERAAILQRRLGERTQNLLNKMERVAAEREEKDKDTADRLRAAASIADDEHDKLVQNMKNTEEYQLRKRQVNKAIQKQQENVATLDKKAKALEEQRADDLERLIKKQKQLQKDLNELADRLEKLQKKARQASRNPDAKERERALKRL